MSNLSIELKVIEVTAPMVARALGEPVALTLGGLNLLWHRCWSLKTDTITAVGLAGIFGPEKLDMRIAQLVDAGFLAPSGQAFRIKGAERYLRIKAGNSKGGHASKSNLIPGGKKRHGAEGRAEGGAEGGAEPQAEREPRGSREEASGLFGSSPNTEHRTPNTESKSSAVLVEPPPSPSRKVKLPDPRHAPLVARLVEAFADDRETAYPFGPRDAKVVSNLLARAEPDVIVAAWERALRHQGYPTVATLLDLEHHLARFVGEPQRDITKGYAQPSIFTETKDVTF